VQLESSWAAVLFRGITAAAGKWTASPHHLGAATVINAWVRRSNGTSFTRVMTAIPDAPSRRAVHPPARDPALGERVHGGARRWYIDPFFRPTAATLRPELRQVAKATAGRRHDKDPEKHADAVLYPEAYHEVISAADNDSAVTKAAITACRSSFSTRTQQAI
jgi:hypothetical protein